MNTRQLLDAAKQDKMSHREIEAHCVWALVSQIGRGWLEVGQVGALVKQTSGFKPSTYQVNRALATMRELSIVDYENVRANAKGQVRGWKARDTAIAYLLIHRHLFSKDDVMWNAVYNLTDRVGHAALSMFNELSEYNQQIDESAK